jgi:hypothetical protein
VKSSRPASFSISQRKSRGLYRIKQLAEFFQMSEAAFYHLLKEGEGPYRQISEFVSTSGSGEKYYKARRVASLSRLHPTQR